MNDTYRRVYAHRKGLLAETVACWWLRAKGYRLRKKRFKTQHGEIDLIMQRGETLVFVEVKARKTHACAQESITWRSQKRIIKAAHLWIGQTAAANELPANWTARFDGVVLNRYFFPVHIVNAFSI